MKDTTIYWIYRISSLVGCFLLGMSATMIWGFKGVILMVGLILVILTINPLYFMTPPYLVGKEENKEVNGKSK